MNILFQYRYCSLFSFSNWSDLHCDAHFLLPDLYSWISLPALVLIQSVAIKSWDFISSCLCEALLLPCVLCRLLSGSLEFCVLSRTPQVCIFSRFPLMLHSLCRISMLVCLCPFCPLWPMQRILNTPVVGRVFSYLESCLKAHLLLIFIQAWALPVSQH